MKTHELIQRQAHTLILNALDGVTHLTQPDRVDLAEQIVTQLDDEVDLTRWSPRELNESADLGHDGYTGMTVLEALRYIQRANLLHFVSTEIDVHLSNLDIDEDD